MSYEGYTQYWCENGHYWKGPDRFGQSFHPDHVCKECGKIACIRNDVDDTNCDKWGHIFSIEKIPVLWNVKQLPEENQGKNVKMRCCNGHITEIPYDKLKKYHQRCGHFDDEKNRSCGAPLSELVE